MIVIIFMKAFKYVCASPRKAVQFIVGLFLLHSEGYSCSQAVCMQSDCNLHLHNLHNVLTM